MLRWYWFIDVKIKSFPYLSNPVKSHNALLPREFAIRAKIVVADSLLYAV